SVDDIINAIQEMYVRGAPLIGVTAAFGIYLAVVNSPDSSISNDYLSSECSRIRAARPTAVNLAWAVDTVLPELLAADSPKEKIEIARKKALEIAEYEAYNCKKIGEYGLGLIEEISAEKNGGTVNLMTHCNAGWLACIEYGTATAPMYAAHEKGINIHVWIDETRPLNQGARLTAWELAKANIPCTVIPDNAGGHLMQHGMVDMLITGTDRTTYTGDVANKIGTYLKALAARDNNVPFYVALPSTTFDWTIRDGVKQIPIEKRNPDEIRYVQGLCDGEIKNVLITPENAPAANYAFDVTPARLVTGFITEKGVCRATEAGVRTLFPEKV
ncbi:S-methyl-5-thioribose-1-phosphate isomerase, partial [Desulfobacterales bacterium HSG16]|nr:S-methyl-5-thioribose-1-phosphate isomerase [Desulfobacterales bacterium HSG16]